MFKAVIDTNVIISALLKEKGIPDLVLSLVLQKKLELCLSKEVFDEYQGVLGRKKFKDLDPKKVKRLLSRIKKQGNLCRKFSKSARRALSSKYSAKKT